MFFWFLGTTVASIWYIFRDPNFNYWYLIVGAIFPDLVDVWFGHAGPLHSIVTSAAILAIVMLATIGKRPLRKRLLAGVFGIFLHLVFDGAFLDTRIFWWPLSGLRVSDAALPSLSRGWLNVPLEIAGLFLLLWTRNRFRVTVSQPISGVL